MPHLRPSRRKNEVSVVLRDAIGDLSRKESIAMHKFEDMKPEARLLRRNDLRQYVFTPPQHRAL